MIIIDFNLNTVDNRNVYFFILTFTCMKNDYKIKGKRA